MNVLIALVLLGAAYGVGSMAIDTGHLVLYLLTVLILFAGLHFIRKSLKRVKK